MPRAKQLIPFEPLTKSNELLPARLGPFDPRNIDRSPGVVKLYSYEITFDPLNLDEERDPQLDQALEGIRDELYQTAHDNPKSAIATLEGLLERFPDSRLLMNWLGAAYGRAGDVVNARRLAQRNYELHPTYLFAKTNYAQILLNEGKLAEADAVMQSKWDLKELYPQRKVFHVSEFLALGHVAVEYFMRTERQSVAKCILRAMRELAPKHAATRDAQRLVKHVALSRALTDIQEMVRKQRAEGWGWRFDGLDDWPTERIFAQLRELSIDTDEQRFAQQAAAAGGFKALENDWLEQISDTKRQARLWEDFPLIAIPVLWERLAAHVICADLIENRLYHVINAEESDQPLPDVDGLTADVAVALELARYLQGFDAPQRAAQYEQVNRADYYDYTEWLLDLIEKRGTEYPDLVTQIADVMSDCERASDFQSRLAEVLALASRRDEAIARARANLERFPDDVWVRISTGDVFDHLGDDAEAIRLWTEALPLAANHDDWDAVVERLEEALDRTGRVEELSNLLESYPEPPGDQVSVNDDADPYNPEPYERPRVEPDYEPPLRLTSARKVGRNEPCPCGSGKKYKKCCMQ